MPEKRHHSYNNNGYDFGKNFHFLRIAKHTFL